MQEENIFELIDGKKYARLRELLSEMNPADIAQICEDIPERELPVIFRILPKELAAESLLKWTPICSSCLLRRSAIPS